MNLLFHKEIVYLVQDKVSIQANHLLVSTQYVDVLPAKS